MTMFPPDRKRGRLIQVIPPLFTTVALILSIIIDFDCRSFKVYINNVGESGYTFSGALEVGLFYFSEFEVVRTENAPCDYRDGSFFSDSRCGTTSVEIDKHGTCAFYPGDMRMDFDWKIAQISAIICLMVGGMVTIALWISFILNTYNLYIHYPIAIVSMVILPTMQGLTFWVQGSSVLCENPYPLFDLSEYGNPLLRCGKFSNYGTNEGAMLLWGLAGLFTGHFSNIQYFSSGRRLSNAIIIDEEETSMTESTVVSEIIFDAETLEENKPSTSSS